MSIIKDYSIFGSTGFIGSSFMGMHPFNEPVPRGEFLASNSKILYLISTTHNYNVHGDISLDVETNLSYLCKVLRALRDSDRCKDAEFNFISSWFVYGSVPLSSLPVSEEFRCDPKGFYSITKYAAEKLIQSFAETFGIKYRIIRLPNILGPGDKAFGPQKNAITWMIHELVSGNQVKLYDDGQPLRDFLHVSDAIEGISLIISKGEYNTIYNVGRGEPTQIGALVRYAAERLNVAHNVISVKAPPFHRQVQSRDMWMNTSKLTDLGFKPSYSITRIVDELISSFQLGQR